MRAPAEVFHVEAYPMEELAAAREEEMILSPVYLVLFRYSRDAPRLAHYLSSYRFEAPYRLKARAQGTTVGVEAQPAPDWSAGQARRIVRAIGSVKLAKGQCLIFAPHALDWSEHLSVQAIDPVLRTHFVCGRGLEHIQKKEKP